VSQILAPDEATAKAAAALVAEGRSFAEAAAELADRGVTSDALGAMTREQLPPELADAIFALATGEVGQPVRSPFGWHVFRLDALEPARTTPFEAVKEQLARQVALQKAADRLPAFADRMDDAIAGGAGLEEAAAEAGAAVRKLEAVDQLGRDRDGTSLLTDGITADIVTAAFAAAEAETPRLGQTPDGGYYMLRVDRIEPARTRPLDEIRGQLTEVWKVAQRTAAAEAQAKELLAQAQAGQSLEALQAATPGSELRVVGPVKRDEPSPLQGLDAAALGLVFRTAPGSVAADVARMQDGMAVIAVDAVERPDPPPDVAPLEARLTSELRGDLLAQYEAALRLRYPPRVNERLFAAMIQAEEG
jgi:peptidyl-prolyl cis-trans isomerase D